MSFKKSLMSNFVETATFEIGIGDESEVPAYQFATIVLKLFVKRSNVQLIENAFHVPNLR